MSDRCMGARTPRPAVAVLEDAWRPGQLPPTVRAQVALDPERYADLEAQVLGMVGAICQHQPRLAAPAPEPQLLPPPAAAGGPPMRRDAGRQWG